jgi:hypothetical protein
MKITNKHNIPATLMALAERDFYTKGKANYSVTEILSPPRIQRLREKHFDEIETDASDMLWSLMGSALHVVAERSEVNDHINEERLYLNIDGVVLSGAIDLQKIEGDFVDITDYKFTSAWALRADKPDWEQQQNVYAYLVEKVKGLKVRSLSICALIRDWSRREAAVKPDYPQAPIQMVQIPLWKMSFTEKFIQMRLDAHRHAKVSADWGDELPECDEEERWIRETKYAVMKEGRKTAVRLFDTQEEADELKSTDPKHYIQIRKGEAVRCTGNFCGVAQWCSQFKREQNEDS